MKTTNLLPTLSTIAISLAATVLIVIGEPAPASVPLHGQRCAEQLQ